MSAATPGDNTAAAVIEDDLIQPFQIEGCGVRGRLARLGPLANEVLGRQDYPAPVAALLGETLALAAVLAGALKYDGIFTFQAAGDGPVKMIVADMTSAGAMRGYVGYDDERLARALHEAELNGGRLDDPVPRLLGKGHLAFTVDQGQETERYQGIVELVGETLAEATEHYFRHSEQIDAGISVAVGRTGANGHAAWRAAALMIQRLPEADTQAETGWAATGGDAAERWRRAHVLMGSVRADELTDPGLTPDRLLYRLFHEEGVRVYRPHPLHAGCRCSRERVEATLRGMSRDTVEELKVDGIITVTCQFCNESYVLDELALEAVYAA